MSARDVGRPFRDLELSYRRLSCAGTSSRRRSSGGRSGSPTSSTARHRRATCTLEVQIGPLIDGDGLLGVTLIFHDVTAVRRLQDELEHANQQLETAYEELQSTNEELETTNEELQSTVEELETTNEELQSTNEELETMNEELQSTNDELQSINEQLRRSTTRAGRRERLPRGRADQPAGRRRGGRPGPAVRVWNRRAEDLWGLRRTR